MNNAIRTVMAILSGLVALAMAVGQCTDPSLGTAVCKASWLTPTMTGYLVFALSAAAVIMKAARPGGIIAGMFGQTAVVTATGAPGTVTKASVETSGR